MSLLSSIATFASTDILNDKEAQINEFSIKTVLFASLVLVVLLVLSWQLKDKYKSLKTPLFLAICAIVLVPTISLFGSTVYLNVSSDSGGPVHWHTDVEYWVCDTEIELRNPSGFLSNKIGSATFHEHNDKRLHLEGVVVEKEFDASLEKFMLLIDGKVSKDAITIPIEDSIVIQTDHQDGDKNTGNVADIERLVTRDDEGKSVINAKNGDTCGSTPASLQAFLFRYNKADKTYTQTKLEDPARYVMRDESVVPPGDCLIIEFGPTKERTDRLCLQYGTRDSKRCTEFGVKTYNPKLCEVREVTSTGGAL